MAEPVEGVNATPYADNPRYFTVAIAGPMDSPYEGKKRCALWYKTMMSTLHALLVDAF